MSKFNLHKLQCIQNSAARIVSNTSRYISIIPALKKLHWLPVEHCSLFKAAAIVYKFLHTSFPNYFARSKNYYLSFHTFLLRVVLTVPGGVIVVVISLSLQSSTLLLISLSQNLVIAVLLMLPLFEMLFLMTFMCPLPSLFQKAA